MRIVRSLVIAETSLLLRVSCTSKLRSLVRLCLRRYECSPCRASSGPWLQARLEQSGKSRSHIDEDQGPQHRHEEGEGESTRRHQSVKGKNVYEHRRQDGHRQRHVAVDQQKYRGDDLKREDHPQIMRGVQGTHELSRDTGRRW